ncbi:MAG: LysR family transcriptional regulator [Pseudohongiellaceae bacterium]
MSRLNYRHLFYFWKVATGDSLTAAAESLHISQSALSTQIRQLEDQVGQSLFERSGRRLLLTPTGRQVLQYAQEIFTRGEALEALLRDGVEPEVETLRIGALSTMSRNFLEAFVAPFLTMPGTRISLHANDSEDLLDALGRYRLDVVLTTSAVSQSGDRRWQTQLIARQPVSIIGPAGLDLHDEDFPDGFLQYRWLLPGPDTDIRAAFDAYCGSRHFEPDIQAEANDMAMLRLLARDSGALAVLPRVVVRDELDSGVLEEYRVLPMIDEHFYAVTAKGARLPTALAERLASLQESGLDSRR